MSEEIKEILYYFEKYHFEDTMIDGKETKLLHDYITNSQEEIERLNNKEEQLIRRLEDLIIVGEQVENEWAVDICKMIIKELKGSSKE